LITNQFGNQKYLSSLVHSIEISPYHCKCKMMPDTESNTGNAHTTRSRNKNYTYSIIDILNPRPTPLFLTQHTAIQVNKDQSFYSSETAIVSIKLLNTKRPIHF